VYIIQVSVQLKKKKKKVAKHLVLNLYDGAQVEQVEKYKEWV